MVTVIAEVGSNHGGSRSEAGMLIMSAREAGADIVKFQHYPDMSFGPHPMGARFLVAMREDCAAEGVGFLASVFDRRTMDEYLALGPVAVKIASPELVRDDLLDAIPDGVHTYLSCGMSTIEQIRHALDRIGPDVTLLHCVSAYPAPPEHMNLRAVPMLRSVYNVRVGLSDHSLNPVAAPVAAVALGARVIEKHLTLDRGADGPDHRYALEPQQFEEMVHAVRLAERMLGDGDKRVMPSEDPTDRRVSV